MSNNFKEKGEKEEEEGRGKREEAGERKWHRRGSGCLGASLLPPPW